MKKRLTDFDLKKLWIKDDLTKEEIERYFKVFNGEMEKLYFFTQVESEYQFLKRDYGNGVPMTMLEAHVLTDINDSPGITVTEIAHKWEKTPSAISQIVKNLVHQNLVMRIRNEQNGKVNNLYITDEGQKLVLTHKQYDNVDIVKTFRRVLEHADEREIDAFFKVAEIYGKILKESIDKNKGSKKLK